MADYRKMYALLCGTIDEVLEELNRIPLAVPCAERLQKALLEAEEMYVAAEEPVLSLHGNPPAEK